MQTRLWVVGSAAVALVALVALGAMLRLRPSSARSEAAPVASHAPHGPAETGGALQARTSMPTAAVGSADGPGATTPPPTPSWQSPAVLARRATRERADAIRKQLDERRRNTQNPPAVVPPSGPEAEQEAAGRRREFLQKAV